MGAIGGSVESVDVGGRLYAVAADAEGTRDIGGFTNEVVSNGDGSTRTIKTRKPWKMDGLSLEIDDDQTGQEYLQNIADGKIDVAMSFTMVSGKVYQGSGTVAGDLQASTQNATAPLNFSGPGKLTQQ